MEEAHISSRAMEAVAQTFSFNREELLALADDRREAYAAAHPFPHTFFDDFLPEEVVDQVLAEFPRPGEDWFAFESPLERKLASKDDSLMGPATRGLLW